MLTTGRATRPSSPPTWGCSGISRTQFLSWCVFPTHVGVFRMPHGSGSSSASLPHPRGGVPPPYTSPQPSITSSPPTWGCSVSLANSRPTQGVFPTHVGVFRVMRRTSGTTSCLPHPRGGVPTSRTPFEVAEGSSPPTWGCSGGAAYWGDALGVFPTHVGVFRRRRQRCEGDLSLPHPRGGVPFMEPYERTRAGSSPPTWGCSVADALLLTTLPVFPTHVGVFRACCPPSWLAPCLPHPRGGVPSKVSGPGTGTESSPPTWGCSEPRGRHVVLSQVFPTHVGVFRDPGIGALRLVCLPHPRGGVPLLVEVEATSRSSSPPTWGCSAEGDLGAPQFAVFPTHVGVFRRVAHGLLLHSRLPHPRGGVP